ncbi:MAG TPA: hypothetical protein VLF66_16355 [Thermoanaerobaculia bacterium]|nr:hypothetical protein [Thermoanaerobaculia bacterium]
MRTRRCAFHLAAAALAVAALLALPAAAGAQHSPYAGGHEDREIKALSPEETEELLSGHGMGLALPAELNGYPGPKHVLELADELELSGEQREAVAEVFDRMIRKAIDLGFEVVAAERRLDALFAQAEATPEALRAALETLEALRADLRYTHLAAHLETKALLTEHQVHRYTQLRGYGGEGHHPGQGHQHGHHPGLP